MNFGKTAPNRASFRSNLPQNFMCPRICWDEYNIFITANAEPETDQGFSPNP